MTQRYRQAVQRVFDYQTHAVRRDQQQKQTDTDTGAVRNALWEVAQDPATNAGGGNNGKQHAHQEHRTQCDRYADLLAQHQAERGERG